ncbi:MAG: hypothetical protein M1819_007100 [Sarea resinae]|nr:MAG: hypothetical protein M1819_007100 [Sarea resinae]
MDSKDPLDWGIDEVITFLCNASAPWYTEITPSTGVEPAALARSIRAQSTTGLILLCEFDRNTLLEEHHITSHGQRGYVWHGILKLRAQSKKYPEYIQQLASNVPLPHGCSSPMVPSVPFRDYFHSPASSPARSVSFQQRLFPTISSDAIHQQGPSPDKEMPGSTQEAHETIDMLAALAQPQDELASDFRVKTSPVDKSPPSSLPQILPASQRQPSITLEAASDAISAPSSPESVFSWAGPSPFPPDGDISPALPSNDVEEATEESLASQRKTSPSIASLPSQSGNRLGETVVVDDDGRKRRRLAPTHLRPISPPISAVPDSEADVVVASEATNRSSEELEPNRSRSMSIASKKESVENEAEDQDKREASPEQTGKAKAIQGDGHEASITKEPVFVPIEQFEDILAPQPPPLEDLLLPHSRRSSLPYVDLATSSTENGVSAPLGGKMVPRSRTSSPPSSDLTTSAENERTFDTDISKATLIEDKPKRRIVPTLISNYPYEKTLTSVESTSESETFLDEYISSHNAEGPTSTQLTKQNASAPAKQAKGERHGRGYLGIKGYSLDDIFYSSSAVEPESKMDYEDEENFAFNQPMPISAGRRLYVDKVMRHYLQNSHGFLFQRGGQNMVAVKPYDVRLLKKHRVQSFTLFGYSNHRVQVTREQVPDWPEIENLEAQIYEKRFEKSIPRMGYSRKIPYKADSSRNHDPFEQGSTRYFDYLLEKYDPADERREPIFNESGSEDDYDLDTWREIEAERGEQPRQLRKSTKPILTQEVVEAAIDEMIELTVQKWKEKRLPRLDGKAWLLWKNLKRVGNQQDLIQESKDHVERITAGPLQKMRLEILKEHWTSVADVRRQSRILEQSVINREELLWKISVLEADCPPKRWEPKKTKKPTLPIKDGEDLAQSDDEEDYYAFDDDLDDFIATDDSDEEEKSTDPGNHSLEYASDHGSSMEPPLPTMKADLATQATPSDSEGDIGTPAKKRRRLQQGSLAKDLKDPTDPAFLWGHSILRPKVEQLSKDGGPDLVHTRTVKNPVVDLTLPSEPDELPDRLEPPKSDKKPVLRNREKKSLSTVRDDIIDIIDDDSNEQKATKGNLPAYGDVLSIAKLAVKTLMEANDSKRLIVKLFNELNQRQRRAIITLYEVSPAKDALFRDINAGLTAFESRKKRIKGLGKEDSDAIKQFAYLFICWATCSRVDKVPDIPSVRAAKKNEKAFSKFHKFLETLFSAYRGSGSLKVLSKVIPEVVINPDCQDDQTGHTPKYNRKRKVVEDAQARNTRKRDQERVKAEDQRRQQLEAELSKMGPDMLNGPGCIYVNLGKEDHQALIPINPYISQRIKPHQIEGVQFIWSGLVMQNDPPQGCLLAHTMGLGKTMQVITFLVTLAEASISDDTAISDQIPPNLRQSRTLILCPPSLIENWGDELLMWTPTPREDNVGSIRKVNSSLDKFHRLQEIAAWYEDGGILVLGYEMFRQYILNKATKSMDRPLDEEQHETVQKQLLEGPNIVVADEAHIMKNPGSAIAGVTAGFRTKSRIALTGSPLANALIEYHAMVNWVAPGYLGNAVEFRATYAEPIQMGLYHDSSAYQKRVSLVKLAVLNRDLAPKINRADITVLKGSMKPKTEFLIKVPLTKIQEDAYRLYVDSLVNKSTEKITQTRLFDWLAVLQLLCNHPKCFIDKLAARDEEQQGQKSIANGPSTPPEAGLYEDEGSEVAFGDATAAAMGISHIQEQIDLFDGIDPSLDSFQHSYRVLLCADILKACLVAGDKALLFSQSIPTLNYLEGMMTALGIAYARLDGKTTMPSRQKATKSFNSTDNTHVYLISTRAGGLGLNLQGANRVILFDFGFNPVWEEQAVGRAYRMGQTKPVFVYRFMTGGTFEDLIHNKAVFKTQLASRVVDKKKPQRQATKNPEDYLFPPKPVRQHDLSEFREKDPLVLDKVLETQSGNIRMIQLTETYNREDEEELTAEEKKESEKMYEEEQLKRDNPDAWQMLKWTQQTSDTRATMNAIRSMGSTSHTPLPSSQPVSGKFGRLSYPSATPAVGTPGSLSGTLDRGRLFGGIPGAVPLPGSTAGYPPSSPSVLAMRANPSKSALATQPQKPRFPPQAVFRTSHPPPSSAPPKFQQPPPASAPPQSRYPPPSSHPHDPNFQPILAANTQVREASTSPERPEGRSSSSSESPGFVTRQPLLTWHAELKKKMMESEVEKGMEMDID